MSTTTTYIVSCTTSLTTADRNSDNTTDDWAVGPITREGFEDLLAQWSDVLRDVERMDATTYQGEGWAGEDEDGESVWAFCSFELTAVALDGDAAPGLEVAR